MVLEKMRRVEIGQVALYKVNVDRLMRDIKQGGIFAALLDTSLSHRISQCQDHGNRARQEQERQDHRIDITVDVL